MEFDEQTEKAAIDLAERLANEPWLFSVGITEEDGSPTLIVYLRSTPYRNYTMPSEWNGYPVKTEYIGQVRPATRRRRVS